MNRASTVFIMKIENSLNFKGIQSEVYLGAFLTECLLTAIYFKNI